MFPRFECIIGTNPLIYMHIHVNCQQGMQIPRFKLKGGSTSNESYMNVPTPQHTTHHTIPSLLCSDLFHCASKRVSYAVSLPPLQRPSTSNPQLCVKSNFKYKICIHKCLWRGRRGGLLRRWWRCLCLRTTFSLTLHDFRVSVKQSKNRSFLNNRIELLS